jgi:hypothetical protein
MITKNSKNMSNSNDHQIEELEVTATEEELKGVYSNLARVTYTKNEFVLGFVFNIGREAHLVSRVIVTPEHMKQINKVISDSLNEYEQKYGK